MPADRVLMQEDLDQRAQTYDFRRTDRIARDQLRNLHLLHENFARAPTSW